MAGDVTGDGDVSHCTPLICPLFCQEVISGSIRLALGSYSQGGPHRILLRQNVSELVHLLAFASFGRTLKRVRSHIREYG